MCIRVYARENIYNTLCVCPGGKELTELGCRNTGVSGMVRHW